MGKHQTANALVINTTFDFLGGRA